MVMLEVRGSKMGKLGTRGGWRVSLWVAGN